MDIKNKNLTLFFLISLVSTICYPFFFSFSGLLFFSSFLVAVYYQKSIETSLWCSFLCGLIIDLLSFDFRPGFYAAAFCLTTVFLYPQRRNFFSDTLSTLPLMTFLFSLLSTLFCMILIHLFEKPMHLSFMWILTDLLYLSLADAAFAFCMFVLPAMFFGKRQRPAQDYFFKQPSR